MHQPIRNAGAGEAGPGRLAAVQLHPGETDVGVVSPAVFCLLVVDAVGVGVVCGCRVSTLFLLFIESLLLLLLLFAVVFCRVVAAVVAVIVVACPCCGGKSNPSGPSSFAF